MRRSLSRLDVLPLIFSDEVSSLLFGVEHYLRLSPSFWTFLIHNYLFLIGFVVIIGIGKDIVIGGFFFVFLWVFDGFFDRDLLIRE